MAGLKKRYGQQRGAAALEAVLLTPAVLLLLYTIAQYSLIFVATQIFTYTAEEALRKSISFVDRECYYGDVDGNCTNEKLKERIRDNGNDMIEEVTGNTLFGQNLDQLKQQGAFNITASEPDGVCCKVTVTYDYSQAPFLPSMGLPVPDTLTGTAMLTM